MEFPIFLKVAQFGNLISSLFYICDFDVSTVFLKVVEFSLGFDF